MVNSKVRQHEENYDYGHLRYGQLAVMFDVDLLSRTLRLRRTHPRPGVIAVKLEGNRMDCNIIERQWSRR